MTDNPDGGERTLEIKGRSEIREQTDTGSEERRRKEMSMSNKEAVTLEGQEKSIPRSGRGERHVAMALSGISP